ncbi:MAG: hypothetical protein GY925_16190, partial [Actinomycetia bacterium]|nr:hypothetical protein [Actinomycetes bacterium]
TTTTEPPTTTTEPPTTTTTTEGDVESASETNDGVLARTGVDSTAVLTLIASALILAGVALFSTANLIARRS